MTIQEYHTRLLLLLDKEQSGYFSPEEIDTALDIASIQLFNVLLSQFGQSGRSIEDLAELINTEWVQPNPTTGEITTALPIERFVSGYTQNTSPTDNWLQRINPTEVGHQARHATTATSADGTTAHHNSQRTTQIPLQVKSPDELAFRLSSQVAPVNLSNPVLSLGKNGSYYVHPTGVPVVNITYLHRPTRPKYNYTESNGQVQHIPEGSQAPEWLDSNADEVVFRAARVLGINLDNKFLAGVG